MAIAAEQTVTGNGQTVSSFTLTSWAPGANELVLVCVATRLTVAVSGVSGNGLTFVNVLDIQDGQSQCRLSIWRAMGSNPSTGQITVTLASAATAVIASAHRFSGVDTTGTNGSGAIEASASANQGATDTITPSVNITTLSAGAWAFGACTHRQRIFTVGSGETAISINNAVGSAGDVTSVSTEYQLTSSPTTAVINGTLDATSDWVMCAVGIKPAGAYIPFDRLLRLPLFRM